MVKDAVPQQACCKAFLPWPILLLQMLEVAPPSPALLCVLPVTLDEFVVESRPDMTLPSPLVWAWLLWRRCRLDSMWLSPLLAPVPLAVLPVQTPQIPVSLWAEVPHSLQPFPSLLGVFHC